MESAKPVHFTHQPSSKGALMLAAWEGWSDASHVATSAVKEIVKGIGAEYFAYIDPEDFYVFSDNRPTVSNSPGGGRVVSWNTNNFYHVASPHEFLLDLIIFVGSEPNIRWRNYTDAMASVVALMDVQMVVMVGALLDSVPHTRKPLVTGSSLHGSFAPHIGNFHYPPPSYEGPAGITSVLSERLESENIKTASVWAHIPHYLQSQENPSATLALLRELERFLPKPIDLDELDADASEFEKKMLTALKDEKDLEVYIRELERTYDLKESARLASEQVSAVEELEEFLSDQRKKNKREDQQ